MTDNTKTLRKWLKTPYKGVRIKVSTNIFLSFLITNVVMNYLPLDLKIGEDVAIMVLVWSACVYGFSKIFIV